MITEELEETGSGGGGGAAGAGGAGGAATGEAGASVYDNYKFVTRAEVDTLGLGHLIGSPLLRG